MQEKVREDAAPERATTLLSEIAACTESVVPEEGRDIFRSSLESARPVILSRLRAYLEQPPYLPSSAYGIALALSWSMLTQRFRSWCYDPSATLNGLLADFDQASRQHLETITSAVYQSEDGKWELSRIYYRQSIDAVGKLFVNCLTPTTQFPGYRYYEASRHLSVGPFAGTPELELYVLRPRGAKEGLGQLAEPPAAPRLLLSYFPALRCLDEIEKPTLGRMQDFLTPDDTELVNALLEIIRASRAGKIPGLVIEGVNPQSLQHIVSRSTVIDSTGEVSGFSETASPDVISGGAFAVHPTTSPEEVAWMAAEYPIELDMSKATQEQRDAITEVSGTLVDNAGERISYPNLRKVRMSFFAAHASVIQAPRLESIGMRLYASSADTIDMPLLTNCFTAYVRAHADCDWQIDETFRVVRHTR